MFNIYPTPTYLNFDHEYWATLHDSVPLELITNEITNEELLKIKNINDEISMCEVNTIYLPIARLLNFYISSNLRRQIILEQFLGAGANSNKIPYIIGITGSVAVGKSTTARLLQILLSRWPEHRKVDLITTDVFLYPNQILNERGIIKKKGFPQSYDIRRLVQFILDIKSGIKRVTAPVYSHFAYDIIPGKEQVIKQPDILILEGLNVLQNYKDNDYPNPNNQHQIFISDFIDFSIYIDAPKYLLKKWYINRFLNFCHSAFSNRYAYFYNYSKSQLDIKEAIKAAKSLWENINEVNLDENIIHTRERANLIMTKGYNHLILNIKLKK